MEDGAKVIMTLIVTAGIVGAIAIGFYHLESVRALELGYHEAQSYGVSANLWVK